MKLARVVVRIGHLYFGAEWLVAGAAGLSMSCRTRAGIDGRPGRDEQLSVGCASINSSISCADASLMIPSSTKLRSGEATSPAAELESR